MILDYFASCNYWSVPDNSIFAVEYYHKKSL